MLPQPHCGDAVGPGPLCLWGLWARGYRAFHDGPFWAVPSCGETGGDGGNLISGVSVLPGPGPGTAITPVRRGPARAQQYCGAVPKGLTVCFCGSVDGMGHSILLWGCLTCRFIPSCQPEMGCRPDSPACTQALSRNRRNESCRETLVFPTGMARAPGPGWLLGRLQGCRQRGLIAPAWQSRLSASLRKRSP